MLKKKKNRNGCNITLSDTKFYLNNFRIHLNITIPF